MSNVTYFTYEEVKTHSREADLWTVIHNNIYDVTKFLNEHPGGPETLLEVAGKDGTTEFEDVGHSEDARIILKAYKIGELHPDDRKTGAASAVPDNPEVWVDYLKMALMAATTGLVLGFVLKRYILN